MIGDMMMNSKNEINEYDLLLKNIKNKMDALVELLGIVEGLTYEDRMYRYYHHSMKVYYLQELTEDIVALLVEICPHDRAPFCDQFQLIYNEGTGFSSEKSNKDTGNKDLIGFEMRRIVEAFLHSKYFLEMAVKYGKKFDKAPLNMPSGWAALVELYKVKV